MSEDSLELLFSAANALAVIHYPPTGESTTVTGVFQEQMGNAEETHEARDGQKQTRSSTLVVRDTVAMVWNGEKVSRFKIRDEVWRAVGCIVGEGIKTVRLERVTQATQSRANGQNHQ